MTVPWLFQELAAGKKTGTAIFEQDMLVKKVFFSKGEVLFAASNLDDDRLGEFLLRQGRMTEAQFEIASATLRKTNKKLGAILFELGILGPKDLVLQVKLQVKHIILSLFNWREGTYRYQDGHASGEDIIPLQMSTGSLILEGIQSLDWQVIRKGLPPMKTVFRPSTDPSVLFQNAPLTADQKAVLALIDGTKSIEHICSQTGIGDFNALKAIYLLIALRMIEPGELKVEAEKASARVAVSEAVTSAETMQEEGAEKPATREVILKAFDALKRQNHFEVLGVNATTSNVELKRKYFRMAKMYHPDRHFEPEMSDLKDKLETLFAGIHDSYQILSNKDRRRQYEQENKTPPDVGAHFEEKRADDYVENYVEKTKSASAYYNAGMKEFTVGNFWGAADAFAWATRLDPVKAPYFFQFGLSLMRIPRRRHEAEENLQKAIEIDPLKPEYHLELGNLYLKSGLKNKALEVYTIALRENPKSEKILEAIKSVGGTVPEVDETDTGGLLKKMFKDKK